jgi:glycosyltransferase involved in cell wall biosynthesis
MPPRTGTLTARAARSPAAGFEAPLVLHLVEHALADGLQDSLLKLLRQMPPGRYRHVILSLRGEAACELRHNGATAQLACLRPGDGPHAAGWLGLYRAFRLLRPALVHTGSVRAQLLAAAAGIRLCLPCACRGAAAAPPQGLLQYLALALGVQAIRLPAALGAIDCTQFHPRLGSAAAALGPPGFLCDNAFVIGAAGTMDVADNHAALVRAFLLLVAGQDLRATPLRLLIAGEGPGREPCKAMLRAAGAGRLAWLPGARDDTARLMRAMDVFVAPEPAGTGSLPMLEAMASGLPVVAALAGDNPELVQPSWNGTLVAPASPELLADAIADYYRIPGLARRHGQRGRRLVLAHHSLAAVADRYLALYDMLLAGT